MADNASERQANKKIRCETDKKQIENAYVLAKHVDDYSLSFLLFLSIYLQWTNVTER